MGNKMCVSGRRAVAERFTRPQRILRQPSDVDFKKLRKLILAQKLAPCFDAVDDPHLAGGGGDLEECPICFLYYPSLNRSRCCAKGICTECFLQMKPSHASRPAQCPFCKTSCYAVEYRGARTEEEKGLEQAEEQMVIEAKIRMQTESQIEERLMPVNQPQTLLQLLHPLPAVEGPSSEQGEESEIAQAGSSGLQESVDLDPNFPQTRHEEVDIDFEEIMVMEAIWKSLQDFRSRTCESSEVSTCRRGKDATGTSSLPCNQENKFSTFTLAEDSPDAISRLAEHDILQQNVSELDWKNNQTDQNPYENVHESSNMQRETRCSSGLRIAEQPCILATELNT